MQSPPLILIVDDNPAALEILAARLSAGGYQVLTASDGEEGLALHVRMSGDLWEALRHFTIPGIDMLANADGFTYPYRMQFYGDIDRRALHMTCKYVHGIVRHSGGREMMSEATLRPWPWT